MKKKLIALLVAALMVVTMLPAMALAEPAAQSSPGMRLHRLRERKTRRMMRIYK